MSQSASKKEVEERPADANWRTRCHLAACYRILYNLHFDEGVDNHLSATCPARDGSGTVMLLIPYGLSWREVTASTLVGMNISDPQNPVIVEEGAGEPDVSAKCIHNGLHQARPDISCVLHSHVRNVTALTCLKDPTLQMLHQNSTRFFDDVCYDTGYDGVASAMEEGFRLGKVIGNKNIMLMGNHGVLVLGKSVADAFDGLYYLEKAAEIQILAMSTGKELSIISDEMARANKEFLLDPKYDYAGKHFAARLRLLESELPNYKD